METQCYLVKYHLWWLQILVRNSWFSSSKVHTCFNNFSGISILGFLYVIYFYKKLVEVERGGKERERLSNVDELNITGVDLEAY